MQEGIIFNIQRHSIHDGPGIRTTVFLKGCTLRCLWCQNPESLSPMPEIQFYKNKCIGCGACKPDRNPDNCYADALVLRGKKMTIDETMAEIDKDSYYYFSSGGGVTFSGGEPLYQPDFLLNLLIACKKKGYHTTVDTAGHVPWNMFEPVVPYVDLWLYDIKSADDQKHFEVTGVSNKKILENLKKLSNTSIYVGNTHNTQNEEFEIIIRIPIIPGINDEYTEVVKIANLLTDIKRIKYVELLALNHFAEGKYLSLGMDYKAGGLKVPLRDDLIKLTEIFSIRNIPVKMQ